MGEGGERGGGVVSIFVSISFFFLLLIFIFFLLLVVHYTVSIITSSPLVYSCLLRFINLNFDIHVV